MVSWTSEWARNDLDLNDETFSYLGWKDSKVTTTLTSSVLRHAEAKQWYVFRVGEDKAAGAYSLILICI